MSFLGLFLQCLSSLLIIVLSSLIWGYLKSPLKDIPGPFFAKFTNLWRFFDTYSGRPELTQRILHERYGNAVRLGPNIVSLSDPSLIRTIYSSKGEFIKSAFYTVNDTKVGNTIIKNAFSTQSNEFHARALRPIGKFYKMSSLLSTQQPNVENTIELFCKRLDEEFVNGPNAGRTCSMDQWLLFFAWDVIGQMTFSKPMGFLEKGKDDTGLLITADKALDYFATIGQIPELDHWLAKNPIMPIGPPSFDSAAILAAQTSIARQQGKDGHDPHVQRDMLDDFIDIKNNSPEMLDDNGIVGSLLINLLAGSDTTAILLRSIVYHVLKNPKVYKRLQRELDGAGLKFPIAYDDSIKLLYFNAVVSEAGRIHPGVGLLLERIVPEGGLPLPDGTVIPAGTIVGMNPWVVHQNKKVFGEDAESFNPDRWLQHVDEGETEEEYKARVTLMKQTDLTFGAGNRICLGRHISLLETFKLIPTLFLRYEFALENPEKVWHVQNSWFVRQEGLDIKIRRRVASS
ncbi:cytochrome P450 [Xylogone sp. PMI_703]|nr:cytochrome P450 [Xylogone sp. PMI_703]